MDNTEIVGAFARAAIATFFGWIAALLLKALGTGKWLTAAGSGAVGSVVALALVG